MSGPGVYVPDVTEGITRVEDLPQPLISCAAATSPAGLPFLWGARWPLGCGLPHRS